MAKPPVVHHWKHGWIPLDATAMAEKRRGRSVAGAVTLEHPKASLPGPPPKHTPLNELPRIQGAHSLREDVVRSNPSFNQGDEFKVNCVHCVNTWELRRRGYDVVATPLPADLFRQNGRSAQDALNTSWRTPSGERRRFTDSSRVGVYNQIAAWPDGARGWVSVNWKAGGAHIFGVERHGGQTTFVDPQRGKVNVDEYFDRATPIIRLVRTDDLTPENRVTQFSAEATPEQRLIAARNASSSSFKGY